MYNDENNLYHYSYRSDSQPGQSYDTDPYHVQPSAGQQPVQEMKPVKKKRMGLRITALALACALLGGVAGGGAVWLMEQQADRKASETAISVSNTVPVEVVVHEVDGKKEMTDAEVYAAGVNSVVSINVKVVSTSNSFFGQTTESTGSGSGFVLTQDGYIATNYHVVEDASSVTVTLYNGDTYEAKYIGGDEDYDIAVIKVEATDLQHVTIGDSSALNVGDHVLAIGNPLGELTFSMSGGMVSSVNRVIDVNGTPFNMIQTDASINPGNSGGPLFNQRGEVVGIVSAKYSSYASASVEGLGFAIPINDVLAMIEDIMTNGYITNKPYLGITGGTMTSQMAMQYRYDVTSGVFIYSVEEGGAAERAGLQMGDVILKVGDSEIASLEDLTAVKKQYSAGDTVTLTVYRGRETATVDLTFDAVPAEESAAETEQNNSGSQYGSQYGGQYGSPYGGYYSSPFDSFFNFFN